VISLKQKQELIAGYLKTPEGRLILSKSIRIPPKGTYMKYEIPGEIWREVWNHVLKKIDKTAEKDIYTYSQDPDNMVKGSEMTEEIKAYQSIMRTNAYMSQGDLLIFEEEPALRVCILFLKMKKRSEWPLYVGLCPIMDEILDKSMRDEV
jgi:hypothetical protein